MIEFPIVQNPEFVSDDRAYNPVYPNVYWPYDMAVFASRNDVYVVCTLEDDGIIVTYGNSDGWDFSSRAVVATPQISNPTFIYVNLTVALTENYDWLIGWAFGPPSNEIVYGYYRAKSDQVPTIAGVCFYIFCYSPVYPYNIYVEDSYIYYVKTDGVYQRTSADNYATETLAYALDLSFETIEIEAFFDSNHRTQIVFTNNSTFWVDQGENETNWATTPKPDNQIKRCN